MQILRLRDNKCVYTVGRVILFFTVISFKIYSMWIGEDKSCFIFCDKANVLTQLCAAGCPSEGPEDSS